MYPPPAWNGLFACRPRRRGGRRPPTVRPPDQKIYRRPLSRSRPDIASTMKDADRIRIALPAEQHRDRQLR